MNPHLKTECVYEGVEDGIEWAVHRAPMYGAANGYAKLPPNHPWMEKNLQWDDGELVDVHGGITYGPKEDGWIGFDTLHAEDRWPNELHPFPSDYDIFWTDEKVKEETLELARAVKMAEFNEISI